MKKLIHLVAGPVAAAALLCLVSVSPSYAATTVFVSGAGSNGNPCTAALPCRSIGYAMDADGGPGSVVSCLDAGPYPEAFSVSYSYTVDCPGVVYSSSNAFAFTLSQSNNGDSQVVTFRNIIFDGAKGGGGAVSIVANARVFFENCTFQNFVASPGIAVQFAPSIAVAQMLITDSIFLNNGLAASGGGIGILPSGSGKGRVTIERSHVEGNTYGIYAVGTGSTGVSIVHIKDTVVANNVFDGIGAYTSAGTATVSMTVDRSSSLLNGGNGILAQGPGSFIFLASSTVMSNGTGLKSAGGTIVSYQDNHLTGNVTDGAPNTVLSVK